MKLKEAFNFQEVRVASTDEQNIDLLAKKYGGKLKQRQKNPRPSWFYVFKDEHQAETFGLELQNQGYDIDGPAKSGNEYLIVVDFTK